MASSNFNKASFITFRSKRIISSKMFTTAIISTLALTASTYRNELDYSFPAGEEVKTPQPHTYIKAEDLPASLDYREQGLLTTDLNQHIPVYCGSCWAHSAFSSTADGLKIQAKGKDRDVIPSVQALINCGHAGSCNGGNSGAANRYVFNNGIPDVTCQVSAVRMNFMFTAALLADTNIFVYISSHRLTYLPTSLLVYTPCSNTKPPTWSAPTSTTA